MFIVGCYQEHRFRDCELACTNEVGCPGALTCLAGMCRASGQTGACSAPGMDGMVDGPVDTPSTTNDVDSDGVVDASDNCPNKANPAQADEDNDRLGDVCDPCPISAAPLDNMDTDHDGVGDGCDPDNTSDDRILVFEGFNVDPAGAHFGAAGFTLVGPGKLQVVTNGTAPAGLAWDSAGLSVGTIYTAVSIDTNSGSPYLAGTFDRQDPTTGVGVACANGLDAAGARTFALFELGAQTVIAQAQGSSFVHQQTYRISQQRAGGGNWRCNRDNGAGFNGSDTTTSGTRWGVVARLATASFDYVLIVGH